ncbi:MAG: hypothetical protein WC300_00080 [Candidatus Omnitrophota bacterium]|jgi:hypothetical protein
MCNTTYKGFGPTFAVEKLFERDKLYVHPEPLRIWFKQADIEYKKRKAPKPLVAAKKRFFGHMVQQDGSHYEWFEDRNPKYVLIGYMDDATGRCYDLFYEYEGLMPAMESLKKYIQKYGMPQSVYLDKHFTYKSTKKSTLEDELNN